MALTICETITNPDVSKLYALNLELIKVHFFFITAYNFISVNK